MRKSLAWGNEINKHNLELGYYSLRPLKSFILETYEFYYAMQDYLK